MSAPAIVAAVYGGGLAVSMFYVGARGIRYLDDNADPEPGMLVFIWPIVVVVAIAAVPTLMGTLLRHTLAVLDKRRTAKLEENRKWLALDVEALARREPPKEEETGEP